MLSLNLRIVAIIGILLFSSNVFAQIDPESIQRKKLSEKRIVNMHEKMTH